MDDVFYNKGSYSWSDLEELIKNEVEENLNLDYKSSRSLDKTDQKKTEIAKDISAFANSNGGIIIYGIEEENHKPVSFSFVDGKIITKEWLENVIDGNIHQRISGIKIFPIRQDGDLSKTVYLVKIPISTDAPHMSVDNKYYRRYNFKSVPMEEYEVRLLYRRESLSEMEFSIIRIKHVGIENENQIAMMKREFSIHVKNIGKSLEKNCKVEVEMFDVDHANIVIHLDKNSNTSYRISENSKAIVSGYNTAPIFPDEEVALLRYSISVNLNYFEYFMNNAVFKVKIYDSYSTKEDYFKLRNLKLN
ncbi:AlbA family DNA-binding domain-containing protein [Rufibacter hautae]|uniref:ATP-binding protein n=1 Tax=Rufibacter hautae TaxID=2595005 RepID=A0A5B6TDD9_9BACT|nr:ATP-binding protein [Rufibacter hautae]KAA3437123.1 ATP-binding protein [Rufibacter hautae]